jgi:arsenite-transporting ATPase
MRVILHTGKGGVGKTTISAATGFSLARRGLRTLVMSVDPAHSLSDSFDLRAGLMDVASEVQVAERLWIHEVDIQREIARHWGPIHAYLATVLNTAGLEMTLAEESAVFPGMEEVSCLLNLNHFIKTGSYDAIVVDCAPTAESLRFITIPATLEWFVRFNSGPFMRARRNLLTLFTPVPPVKDDFFDNLEALRRDLQGIDAVLTDSSISTVRLVTNPEKVVLRETQRAFTYFCLSGLTVDAVIVNRVLPADLSDDYFSDWKLTQKRWLDEVDEFFTPVPVWQVPLLEDEVLGHERLQRLGALLYDSRNPAALFCDALPFRLQRAGRDYRLRIRLPFVSNEEVRLYRKGDELIVQIAGLKRHISLPPRLAGYQPAGARIDEGELVITITPPAPSAGRTSRVRSPVQSGSPA